ncbi:MAG: hypothetical protein Kow0042_16490 [Calditrichia bacterium]
MLKNKARLRDSLTQPTPIPRELHLPVVSIHWHTDSLFEIQLERRGLHFLPGDCLSIFAEDGQTSRPYSIASGIRESHLSFLIKPMDEGIVTTYLQKMTPGHQVKVSSPYGWFRPGQANGRNPFIFIATGTGVAPFLSYIRSFPNKPPAGLLYGVPHLEDAIGWQEFRPLCPVNLAISREKKAGFHHGHVTELLDHLPFTPATHFYLCGLDAMIDDVSVVLEAKGITPLNIHTEVFFHASSE